MLYDLSAIVPLVAVVVALAAVGAVTSLVVLTRELARHHRIRTARQQTVPTYYRRLVLAH